jgi:hypothetical protein
VHVPMEGLLSWMSTAVLMRRYIPTTQKKTNNCFDLRCSTDVVYVKGRAAWRIYKSQLLQSFTRKKKIFQLLKRTVPETVSESLFHKGASATGIHATREGVHMTK